MKFVRNLLARFFAPGLAEVAESEAWTPPPENKIRIAIERIEGEISLVVREPNGKYVGHESHTLESAVSFAADMYGLARLGTIRPAVVSSNDPNAAADVLLFKAAPKPATHTQSPASPPPGQPFRVTTWPRERLGELIGRRCRFVWNQTGSLKGGRIVRWDAKDESVILTIETDIGGILVWKGLCEIELYPPSPADDFPQEHDAGNN